MTKKRGWGEELYHEPTGDWYNPIYEVERCTVNVEEIKNISLGIHYALTHAPNIPKPSLW